MHSNYISKVDCDEDQHRISSIIVHKPVTIVCPLSLVQWQIIVLGVYVSLGRGVVIPLLAFNTYKSFGITSGKYTPAGKWKYMWNSLKHDMLSILSCIPALIYT